MTTTFADALRILSDEAPAWVRDGFTSIVRTASTIYRIASNIDELNAKLTALQENPKTIDSIDHDALADALANNKDVMNAIVNRIDIDEHRVSELVAENIDIDPSDVAEKLQDNIETDDIVDKATDAIIEAIDTNDVTEKVVDSITETIRKAFRR